MQEIEAGGGDIFTAPCGQSFDGGSPGIMGRVIGEKNKRKP